MRKDTFVLMGFCSCHISEHHLQNCNLINWPSTRVNCHPWFATLLHISKRKYWPVTLPLQMATERVHEIQGHIKCVTWCFPSVRGRVQWSMTVVCHIHYSGFLPAKDKVAKASTEYNTQAQPDIVCHENQHKKVANHHLNHVQECL